MSSIKALVGDIAVIEMSSIKVYVGDCSNRDELYKVSG